MADAGVLQPAAGFGVAEKVVRVAQRFPQQYAVGAGAAGADQKGRHVLQRQRAAHYRLQGIADVGILVIAGLAAPRLFVQYLLVDGLQLIGRVFVAAGDGGVFAPFPGGPALVAGAPADHPRHQFVALVGVQGFYVLDYQRLRIAALAFLDVQHSFDAVDGVAGAQVAVKLPIVAGKEAVDAGQPPAGAARPVAHIGGAGMADDGAVFGIGGVFLIPEQGVGVADAVDEIQQRPQGGVADEIFGAQPGADHCFGAGDGVRGDAAVHFGQRFGDAAAFIVG